MNLWLPVSLYPPAQKDLAIKSNESTDMLIGRLDADLVSIAGGIQEHSTAGMMGAAAPWECVVGFLVAGGGEAITCPGAVLQIGVAAALEGQAVASGSIAITDGGVIVSMLRGRNGGGGGGGKQDIKQVEAVAREFKMTEEQRREFGDFVEAEKAAGNRGTANARGDFTYQELRQKASEFLDLYYK